MSKLEVKGIEVFGQHGCWPQEKLTRGRFRVDLVLHTDLEAAAKSDQLEDAPDYTRIIAIVHEEMAIPSKLIEHVGARIRDRLKLEFPSINRVVVTVAKLRPPVREVVGEVNITLEG
ncbi:MAG: dihydroneopterin aldolase [Salibacteraceae bacterium]